MRLHGKGQTQTNVTSGLRTPAPLSLTASLCLVIRGEENGPLGYGVIQPLHGPLVGAGYRRKVVMFQDHDRALAFVGKGTAFDVRVTLSKVVPLPSRKNE